MFRSVSSCTPNNQVTVDFVSSQTQDFYTAEPATVRVNGAVVNSLPVELNAGDLVEMTVTTPAGYLSHRFYEYILDSRTHYFATANKNLYNPTVKPADAPKKWFNYLPSVFQISFYSDRLKGKYPLGFGREYVDIPSSHVICDHINDAVCFYSSTSQRMIARVALPGGPIDYCKTTYTKADGVVDHEVVVLCNNNRLYKIRFDHQYIGSDEYNPTVIPVAISNNLPFEQDLPTGETFIEALRNRLLTKLSPLITALDINQTNVWLAGYDSVFILTKNFGLIRHIVIERQTIISIACLNNDAIVTTRSGNAYYVSSLGVVTFLYTAAALGTPCSFNSRSAVALPDPNNQRLIIFVDNSTVNTVWNTPDFVPAYVREFNGRLWVTGHDTNQVLEFTNQNNYKTYSFDNKVTVVSVVNDSIIGVHYLQEFSTLESPGIKKVIPFEVEYRRGPVSHIGTTPVVVKNLGQENVEIIPGPGLTGWVNGISNEQINTGDYVGVSYRADKPGKYRSAFVVGETAVDYEVDVITPIDSKNYFVPNAVALPRLSAPYSSQLTPTVGNLDSGTTSISLGFDVNFFGNTYSQINVSTNGYITFGNSVPTTATTTVGGIGVDAIYVETQDLYQGNAINNSIPTNITSVPLSSGETPGVYYKTGTLGDFNFVRVRWVGTSMSSLPLGANVVATTAIAGSTRIPVRVSDLPKVKVNDYVSGSGITATTRISGTDTTALTGVRVLVGNTQTNTLYVDSSLASSRSAFSNLNNDFIYSTVENLANGARGYLQSFGSESVSTGNNIVHYDILPNNVINLVVNGLVPSNIDTTWVARISYTTPSPTITGVIIAQSDFFKFSSIAPLTVILTALGRLNQNSFYVSSSDYNLVYPGLVLNHVSFVGGTAVISNKAVDSTGFRIDTFASHNIQPGDSITAQKTTLVFTNSTLNSVLNSVTVLSEFLRSRLVLDTVAGIVPTPYQSTSVNISGNYMIVTTPTTVSANTVLTLKTLTVSTPALTYEAGIYVNNVCQLIEVFYDSPNHLPTTPTGLASSQIKYLPSSKSINTEKSAVFYNPDLAGIQWTFLGNGSINTSLQQVKYRTPEIFKSVSEYENHARVEFIIDQNIKDLDGVLISTDYGFLTANTGYYTGNANVSYGTLMMLDVPLSTSVRGVAPTITLGQNQFSVPVINPITLDLNETVYLNDNQPTNSLVSGNATIAVSGTYYFPDYYRFALINSNVPVLYSRTRNGQTVTLTDRYNELVAGDVITVNNFLTAPGIYDNRDVVLVGPEIIRLRWRTSLGSSLFDTLNYGTLVQPYVNNIEYDTGIYSGVLAVTETENYKTQNIALTAATSITGNLYIDTPGVSFIVDGVATAEYAINVTTGSNIALYRKFYSYLQGNVTIYQVFYDAVTTSNVHVPIGYWNVNNRIISSGIGYATDSQSSFDLDSYFEPSSENLNKDNLIVGELVTDNFGSRGQVDIESNVSSDSFMMSPGIKLNLNSQTISMSGNIVPVTGSGIGTYKEIPILVTEKSDSYEYSYLMSRIAMRSNSEDNYQDLIFSNKKISAASPTRISYISSDSISRYFDANLSFLTARIGSLKSSVETFSQHSTDVTDPSDITYLEIDKIKNQNRSDSADTNFIEVKTQLSNRSISNEYNLLSVNSVRAYEKSITGENSFFNIKSFLSDRSGSEKFTINNIDFLKPGKEKFFNLLFKNSQADVEQQFTLNRIQSVVSSLDIPTTFIDKLKSQATATGPVTFQMIDQLKADLPALINYLSVTAAESSPEASVSYFSQGIGSKSEKLTVIIKYNTVADYENQHALMSSLFDSQLIAQHTKIIGDFDAKFENSATLISKNNLNSTADPHTNLFQVDLKSDADSSITVTVHSPEFKNEIGISLLEQQVGFVTAQYQLIYSKQLNSLVFENEILNTLTPIQDIEPLYPHPLTPIQDIEPLYPHPLTPIQDIEPLYPYPLMPMQDLFTTLLPPLSPMQFYETNVFLRSQYVIDNGVVWQHNDFTVYGAYKTQIVVYADNGRGGDNVTQFAPLTSEDLGRLPFVLLSKTYSLGPSSFDNPAAAEIYAEKYVRGLASQIIGTDFWNYRIYLNTKRYSVPRKGRIFPVTWYKRGG